MSKATKMIPLQLEYTVAPGAADAEFVVDISVRPPDAIDGDSMRRRPIDVICVVDVSGSMQQAAMVKTAEGEFDGDGLTRLSLVQQAIKMISKVLGAQDTMAIVKFSTTASVVMAPTAMDDEGRERLLRVVRACRPESMTNLWEGIRYGLDLVPNEHDASRSTLMMVFTDGEANTRPVGGERHALKEYLREHPGKNCCINTYGFGYTLDAPLLLDIAREGNGTFTFVPDSSFVGTAFVNSVSACMTTAVHNAVLVITPVTGTTLHTVHGLYDHHIVDDDLEGETATHKPSTMIVPLGPVLLGQPRNAVITVAAPQLPTTSSETSLFTVALHSSALSEAELATANVTPLAVCEVRAPTTAAEGDGGDGGVDTDVITRVTAERLRLDAAHHIHTAVCEMETTAESDIDDALTNEHARLTQMVKAILAGPASEHERVVALVQDLSGQVTEALSSTEYFKKWGRHYLLSLARSHMLQQCANFKDPGLQVYGGDLFAEIRDVADDIFLSTPAEAPSTNGIVRHVGMSMYHASSNPCFHGSCCVRLAAGSTKRVDAIVKGDVLYGGHIVRCVVRTQCAGGVADLCRLKGGLLVTPWHPVRWPHTGTDGVNMTVAEWCFPDDVCESRATVPCSAVYSFVLESGHVMTINGTDCVTLAHGFTDNDVVRHAFYGTRRVVDALMEACGIDAVASGLVHLPPNSVVKDPNTGIACGFASWVGIGDDSGATQAVAATHHEQCRDSTIHTAEAGVPFVGLTA